METAFSNIEQKCSNDAFLFFPSLFIPVGKVTVGSCHQEAPSLFLRFYDGKPAYPEETHQSTG